MPFLCRRLDDVQRANKESKLPTPAEWVTIGRIRVKDAVTGASAPAQLSAVRSGDSRQEFIVDLRPRPRKVDSPGLNPVTANRDIDSESRFNGSVEQDAFMLDT